MIIYLQQQIQKLNRIRYTYYCQKYKPQFRKWLWEKIREPKFLKTYHPKYLFEYLFELYLFDENAIVDIAILDMVLSEW